MKAEMLMYSGNIIDVLNLKKEDIHLEDIIHGLSKQQRFMGQMDPDYTVAQHSVLCARLQFHDRIVPDEQVLWALIHDFQEAYIMDIPTPIKNNLYLKDHKSLSYISFRDKEDEIFKTVIKALRVDCYETKTDHNILSYIDKQMLKIEQAVFSKDIEFLKLYPERIYESIGRLSNQEAKVMLTDSYKEVVSCLYHGKPISPMTCPIMLGI